jgi:predicted nucleic acid-binding protein
VARLDALATAAEYLPITTVAMRLAAELWAQARQQGQPTAGDNTIDADMILAAQALTLGTPDVVIATTNIGLYLVSSRRNSGRPSLREPAA